MRRMSPWGRSTYKVTDALTEEPIESVLLPFFWRTSLPCRRYSSSGNTSYHKNKVPASAEVERYFLSVLAYVGSCHWRRFQRPPSLFLTPKKDTSLYRHPQRRQLSGCWATKVRSDEGTTQSEPPPGSSETTASLDGIPHGSGTKHDNRLVTDTEGEYPKFRPFFRLFNNRSGSIKQDTSADNDQAKERQAEPGAQCDALENGSSLCEPDAIAYEELQQLSRREINEEKSAEVKTEWLSEDGESEFAEQVQYLRTVRELEEKLQKARHKLHMSMKKRDKKRRGAYWQEEAYVDQDRIATMHFAEVEMTPVSRPTVKLKKEDFLNLVDLYFYSHRSRFLSESPDASPTPLQLEDYSFRVSEDFSPPTGSASDQVRDDEGTPISPLHQVEVEIKSRKLNEIKTLQNFVDLLVDDYSSLKDLFYAYKALPQPGVSYLSGGVIRLFLQRMSTPWRKSEKAMLRYLSLIDDMQRAGLPITAWEWSSAIYLAGHSFPNVSNSDVSAAFRVWRQMEKDAGVAARDVTFNILFDIAVKAEKFVLAEEILREMHERGFRLNRLGRVSLMYYYGKKGDGDGVRKAYRDFVEAGEIVDTLVLNCVMASLINAQEPAAAEQIYERMKGMQERLRRRKNSDGEEALFLKYPPPGPRQIGTEMASNALGRVLLNASRLKAALPDHHAELQNIMPLTPDAITYRTLLFHHAKTSGNIDRFTVLLDDMTQRFRIPVTPLIFQFLFRGFAMHGGSNRSDAKWTRHRLQIAWVACLVCMKAGQAKDADRDQKATLLGLPSVEEAEAMASDDEKRASEEASRRPKPRKPTAWDTFIKQFMSPYPPTRPFDLYPTSLGPSGLPAQDETGPGEDYQLPRVDLTPQRTSEDTAHMNPIQPTKHLALWAIRAFTRCTSSRVVLEDVWYELARVWRPVDLGEKAVAVRELHRALRYCDTHGKK